MDKRILKNSILGALIIFGILFHLFIVFHNHIVLQTGQHEIIDYSIYLQTIQTIASGEVFNPYLSVRGMEVYNDHFDLVIHPLAYFMKLTGLDFNYSQYLDFFFLVIAALFVSFKALKSKSNFHASFVVLSLLFFNQFHAQGLMSPTHPSTWAIFPIVAWSYYLGEKNWKMALATLCFLIFYKEVYVFWLIFFSLYMYILKEKKILIGCGVLLVVYFTLLIIIRDGGATSHYISQFLSNPDLLNVILNTLHFSKVLWWMTPLFVLLIGQNLKKKPSGEFVVLLLSLGSYYFTHVVLERPVTLAHYAPTVGAIFLGFILVKGEELKLRSYHVLIVIGLLGIQWFHPLNHLVNSLAYSLNKPLSPETKEKILEIKEEISENHLVLASFNLTPFLILPPSNNVKTIFFNDEFEKIKIVSILKNPLYFDSKKVEDMIARCRLGKVESEYNSEEIYIARGVFTEDCLTTRKHGILREQPLSQEVYRSLMTHKLSLKDLF